MNPDELERRAAGAGHLILAVVNVVCHGVPVQAVVGVIVQCAGLMAKSAGWNDVDWRLFCAKVWDDLPKQRDINAPSDRIQ